MKQPRPEDERFKWSPDQVIIKKKPRPVDPKSRRATEVEVKTNKD